MLAYKIKEKGHLPPAAAGRVQGVQLSLAVFMYPSICSAHPFQTSEQRAQETVLVVQPSSKLSDAHPPEVPRAAAVE